MFDKHDGVLARARARAEARASGRLGPRVREFVKNLHDRLEQCDRDRPVADGPRVEKICVRLKSDVYSVVKKEVRVELQERLAQIEPLTDPLLCAFNFGDVFVEVDPGNQYFKRLPAVGDRIRSLLDC